jgi:hypothetical protein
MVCVCVCAEGACRCRGGFVQRCVDEGERAPRERRRRLGFRRKTKSATRRANAGERQNGAAPASGKEHTHTHTLTRRKTPHTRQRPLSLSLYTHRPLCTRAQHKPASSHQPPPNSRSNYGREQRRRGQGAGECVNEEPEAHRVQTPQRAARRRSRNREARAEQQERGAQGAFLGGKTTPEASSPVLSLSRAHALGRVVHTITSPHRSVHCRHNPPALLASEHQHASLVFSAQRNNAASVLSPPTTSVLASSRALTRSSPAPTNTPKQPPKQTPTRSSSSSAAPAGSAASSATSSRPRAPSSSTPRPASRTAPPSRPRSRGSNRRTF